MARKGKSRRTSGGGGKRIRYAVVGLGHIAQAAVLPAFRHAARNSELAALVSSEPRKLRALGRRYGVEHLCRYDELDALFASGVIDAVYLALPNDMHRDFTVRAARAGMHVLCEKPMAVTARDCEAHDPRNAAGAGQAHDRVSSAFRAGQSRSGAAGPLGQVWASCASSARISPCR